jgi:hypothetical protein
MSMPEYDGYNFWYWYPRRNYMIWFDTPITTEELEGSNVCYRLQGNVWFCPSTPAEELPPEPIPLPTGNIKPSMTLTSVKMENHPEHIAVMFGQVLSSLK